MIKNQVTIQKNTAPSWSCRMGVHHEKFGDKYESVCTAKLLDSGVIELSAFGGPIASNRQLRQLLFKFADLGYFNFIWDRVVDGVYSRRGAQILDGKLITFDHIPNTEETEDA